MGEAGDAGEREGGAGGEDSRAGEVCRIASRIALW